MVALIFGRKGSSVQLRQACQSSEVVVVESQSLYQRPGNSSSEPGDCFLLLSTLLLSTGLWLSKRHHIAAILRCRIGR